MSEEEFDVDAVLDEVKIDVSNSPNKKQKRRRIGQDTEGNEEFKFDFDIDETKIPKAKSEKSKSEKSKSKNAKTSELDEFDALNKELEVEIDGNKDEKSSPKTKGSKGKRIMDLDGLDFGNKAYASVDDVENENKKNNKNAGKSKSKRRSIVGNEFDVLEEELEQIQAMQKQMKTSKAGKDKETKEEKDAESRKKFQNVFRLLILLVLVMSVVLSFAIIQRNKAEMDTKRIKISQPSSVSNSSNYIFVDAKLKIEDESLEIKKLRLDSQELAVYLDKPVDFQKYKFHVLDENLYRYYETTNYDQKFVKGSEAKLTFEPLDAGSEKFSIRVENIETGYFAETIFVLEAPLKYPQTKYYYNTTPLNTDLYISSTIFSSAFTKTVLVGVGKKEDVENIAKANIENGNLYIKHKNELVPVNSGEVEYAYFDEYGKGISIFKNTPLDSLQGNVEFGAKMVSKQQTVNTELNIFDLNMGKKVNGNIGNNVITLEGIYNYDGIVVIPMSGVKENAVPSNPKVVYDITPTGKYEPMLIEATDDVSFNQIAVRMDAVLISKDDKGEEFEVKADCKVGVGGTDVVFEDERLKGKSYNDMKIIVNNYSTVEDGFKKGLNLQYVQTIPKNTDEEFKTFVKESFRSRLKYKSKEITKSYITGFSENVVTNFLSSGLYVPVDTMTTAYYSVNLHGFGIEGNEYYAIVDESWIAKGKDGVVMRMENRHKIVAEKQGRNYEIVYDKIMNENE